MLGASDTSAHHSQRGTHSIPTVAVESTDQRLISE